MSHGLQTNFGITEYPNTFKRQGSFPLDNSSVFKSLNDATEYANSNPIAYEGQIKSVIDNDTINVYILKSSDDVNTNFKLSNISSNELNNTIIDMTNLIKSKIGLWTISKNNGTDAYLDFDILYSMEADSYEVYYNDELVSERLSLTDEFITDLNHFKDDSILITLKFYNNDPDDSNNGFVVTAKPLYKNKVVILGDLYLQEIF